MAQAIHALLPHPSPIPGPSAWLELLSFATFTGHLLVMNALLGVLLIAFIRGFAPTGTQGAAKQTVQEGLRRCLPILPKGVAITVNLAVPPLLFVQVLYGQFFYTSTIIQGVWWLGVMMLVMMAYYGLYIAADETRQPLRQLALGISAALLLATAFILTANAALVQNPQTWANWLPERTSALLLAGAGAITPRFLHSVLASFAVGGVCIALYAEIQRKNGHNNQEPLIKEGLTWFSHATLGQLIIGSWYFLSLTAQQQNVLLTSPVSHALYTCLFAGMALALWFAKRCETWRVTFIAALLVAIMVGLRAFLRHETLLAIGGVRPQEYAVAPSILILFLVSVAGAGGAIVWVLYLARKAFSTPYAPHAANGEQTQSPSSLNSGEPKTPFAPTTSNATGKGE